MKSVMRHSFSEVPSSSMPRSQFDRSHGHKTTLDADYIYPIMVDEVLPGDTFRVSANFFARMATPIYPVMDNMFLDVFFFAVPMRLLWTNWEKFLGAQDNPGDSIDFTIPTMTSTTSTGYADESLHDYLGIPPGVPDFVHSSMFHRAYNLIYNDWFRDQNLQDSVVVDVDDGPDLPTDYVLLKRGKRHDYFTSCLPWPQKSDTAVSMPLGTTAPIYGIDQDTQVFNEVDSTLGRLRVEGTGLVGSSTTPSGGADLRFSTNSGQVGLVADLANATAATINAMRLAVTTQKFLERDARGGTRINEIILSHFGVVTPDHRVQRPEYLGGGTEQVMFSTVPQTSQTATTPQGTVASFATISTESMGFVKSFTEHCILMCLVNIRADLTYQNGVERMFNRETRYDFYWPSFANIGEQAVLRQEIHLTDPAGGTNEDVFGYQERYAEYRYKPSRISGKFRSNATGTLDPWHLSQDMSNPQLNATFIVSNTPMARVEAVSGEPDFIFDSYFSMKCVRPMPLFGVPGLARF